MPQVIARVPVHRSGLCSMLKIACQYSSIVTLTDVCFRAARDQKTALSQACQDEIVKTQAEVSLTTNAASHWLQTLPAIRQRAVPASWQRARLPLACDTQLGTLAANGA